MKSANQISNGIMDGNTNLLGNMPSWHIRKDVGMTAINDSLMLWMMSYNITKIFFGDDDKLKTKIQDLLREVRENTVCGRLVLEQMRKASNLER